MTHQDKLSEELTEGRAVVDAWCARYANGMPPVTARGALLTELLSLRSATPMPGVVVKPLEWETYEDGRITSGLTHRRIAEWAQHPFGAYFLEHNQDDDTYWVTDGFLGDEIGGPFGSDHEARAAEQAHFNTRIFSALSPPSTGETGEVALILEGGTVAVGEDSQLQAMFDALPEVPHGGVKSVKVYASPPPREVVEISEALPAGHRVIEQCDTPDGRISQTIEYRRIVRAE